MRFEKCAMIASDTLYARISGELDRNERLRIFESITEAAVRWNASEIIVDKRGTTPIGCLDNYGSRQWDHEKIAELLNSAGVNRLLIAALPEDALAGDLIIACRSVGIRSECLAFFDVLDRVA